MTSLTRPLLDGENRDASTTLPALQKLLQLAYSEDTDEQLEAVMGISKMIERRRFEASLFGPLCHTLSRLVVSEQRTMVAYAARGIKLLMLDDALRPQATAAGIPSVLAAAMGKWEDDAPCLREILGGLQTLCCDKSTVLAVVNAGALGPVLELLGTSNLLLGANNLEIRILLTAIAANVLSFSDSLLLTNEEVIDAFSDCMDALLDAAKSDIVVIQGYGLSALANACAHPVLAGRARDLGALELLRTFEVEPTAVATVFRAAYGWFPDLRRQRAATAVARMNGFGLRAGDIEEGGGGGGETGGGPGKLQFYSFKWGVKPYALVSSSPRDRLWAVLGFVFRMAMGFVFMTATLTLWIFVRFWGYWIWGYRGRVLGAL